jgi:N-acetylglucosaminyldiphosphoundecaprenol N-acetyl-beta-D-mannosaminyltransferase
LSPTEGTIADKSWLGHCWLSKVSREELLSQVSNWIATGEKSHYGVAINVSKLVAMSNDDKLAGFIDKSSVNIADGMPVFQATRLTGDPIKERITGVGLMEDLLQLADKRGFNVYFLGSKPAVLEAVLDLCRQRFPSMKVAGSQDGYYPKGTELEVAKKIGETNPDLVFVALGVPQKEYFVDDYLAQLNAGFVLPVGGAFDVLAGTKVRAPDWVQNVGIEWLWRSFYDRSRAGLIRKSFLPFIGIVVKEIYRQRIRGEKGPAC